MNINYLNRISGLQRRPLEDALSLIDAIIGESGLVGAANY